MKKTAFAVKHFSLSLVFVFLFLTIISSRAVAEHRLALVIGNSEYKTAMLANPVHDVTDIAGALQKLGFTVILKKNAGLQAMDEALHDFGAKLKDKKGVGLFYFAGHGLQLDGTNYLVPVDAKIKKETDVKYETMDAGRILDEMSAANNGLNIVILDACRDNPFPRSFRSVVRGLAIISGAPEGTYISYSTAPGQVAFDGEGRNSPFASALLQYIVEPGVPIEKVFKNVRHRLSRETDGRQVPWESSSLDGDFFFSSPERSAEYTPEAEEKATERKPIAVKPRRPTAERKPGRALPGFFTDPSTSMEFVLVKGGCFEMGDKFGDGDPHERPVHEVCVDDFYIGKCPVTQWQWTKTMGVNPSHFKSCGTDCPVENANWADVQSFIAELNARSGGRYRLPTEAEWEYAARSGGRPEKWSGTSGEGKIGEYAWHGDNAGDTTHPVGRKKPNGLGLYDMTGNVWEWIQDWYGETYYQASPRDNPTGPEEGSFRVVRGGCILDRARDLRTTTRYYFAPANGFRTIGLRLVRTAP